MNITAAMVKELRERTGAGMMECKKALNQTGGDIEAGLDLLRKKGAASADKKSSRVAAEGLIHIKIANDSKSACIVEINCETDFVAKDTSFQQFCEQVTDIALANKPKDIATLSELKINDNTIENARLELVAKIGENIKIRRFKTLTADDGQQLYSYTHGSRIGVLVSASANEIIGKDIAMHIAATKPISINEDGIPQEKIEKEKDIFLARAQSSGKPEHIIEKIVEGGVKKFLRENSLLNQAFVKNPDQTVQQYLKSNNASINTMIRYEVGEGIEKKQENFAQEVLAVSQG